MTAHPLVGKTVRWTHGLNTLVGPATRYDEDDDELFIVPDGLIHGHYWVPAKACVEYVPAGASTDSKIDALAAVMDDAADARLTLERARMPLVKWLAKSILDAGYQPPGTSEHAELSTSPDLSVATEARRYIDIALRVVAREGGDIRVKRGLDSAREALRGSWPPVTAQ